eukprot:503700-Rhodomonas_salina.1
MVLGMMRLKYEALHWYAISLRVWHSVWCDLYWYRVWRYLSTLCGTGIAYGAIALRVCYALSSTDMAYGAITC